MKFVITHEQLQELRTELYSRVEKEYTEDLATYYAVASTSSFSEEEQEILHCFTAGRSYNPFHPMSEQVAEGFLRFFMVSEE